jgi:phosphoribulokinase
MPDKLLRMARWSMRDGASGRPVMLAIAGNSGAGKTTLAHGLVEAIGADNCTLICTDDYHRFDRAERRSLPITAAEPAGNYLDIMEQHLQLLATGQPILKPVYDHSTGRLIRPEHVRPKEFVIVEGLLPLASRLAQACFDVAVYVDTPEPIRIAWKIHRDCASRGYDRRGVLAEIDRSAAASARHIQPQQRSADIVVTFSPIPTRQDPPDTPLSAELLLRPTIRHPSLAHVLSDRNNTPMHLRVARDQFGLPVDRLHVHGHATVAESRMLAEAIWADLATHRALPDGLGALPDGAISRPLGITQLILLYHLVHAQRELSLTRSALRFDAR